MSKGLEALKYLKENKRKHWLDNDKSNECLNDIEKELKDQRKKLTIIGEILVDISKGNYSDLKVAIKKIREAL